MTFGLGTAPADRGVAPRAEVQDGAVTEDKSLSAFVFRLRAQFDLDHALDDETIAASFAEISRFEDPFARVQAAFDSTLGHWLALKGFDLESALQLVVAEVPKQRL